MSEGERADIDEEVVKRIQAKKKGPSVRVRLPIDVSSADRTQEKAKLNVEKKKQPSAAKKLKVRCTCMLSIGSSLSPYPQLLDAAIVVSSDDEEDPDAPLLAKTKGSEKMQWAVLNFYKPKAVMVKEGGKDVAKWEWLCKHCT